VENRIILIGLDLGTQGVRAIAASEKGGVLAEASRRYETINTAKDPWKEQDAAGWRRAAFAVLAELSAALRAKGLAGRTVLSLDGTSGTVVPLDRSGAPLRSAILYNDSRAGSVLARVHEKTAALEEKLGYRMGASFGLPKIVWLRENEPAVFEKTAVFAHQADYLAGCLTGDFRVTDYSNALKTGYDLLAERWPEDELRALGLDPALLPRVVHPGEAIGRLTPEAARETGLPPDTLVAAGVTDGYASCVSSGVVRPGQYNSTIGTTLVLKGVTKNFIRDPGGRVYCHKHPEGFWYPGGAGNVGGLCLNKWFGPERFEELNRQVPRLCPTGSLVYPLTAKGERFPFVAPEAEAFFLYEDESEAGRYAAAMEGVGYVERLCFQTLAGLGCELGDEITITGGAVKAPVWSQVRADILGRRLVQPETAEAAFGAAILAGTKALGRTLTQSAEAMVRFSRAFEPDAARHERYDELYARFCAACAERGYIHGNL
jgi:sugar (pentulose or hexulose) kinase